MRVIKIQAVIGQSLPGVDPGTVSPVIVGLQAFPALQFDVRDHKIQLQPVLVPVLHPKAGVLVAIQTGQQCLLELLHQTLFLIVREVFFPEPRQPGGCKLKTAPVRPVVAARPAEYVCSEDLFY